MCCRRSSEQACWHEAEAAIEAETTEGADRRGRLGEEVMSGQRMRRTVPFSVVRASGATEPEIIISSEAADREGDVVVQSGGDWSGWWKTGAPVLWSHDHRGLPIAKGTRLWQSQGRTHATLRWVEGDEFADRVKNVFSQGLLAASIGFIPDASAPLPGGGTRYDKWRGIEFSLTPVPANVDAIAVSRSLGLPVEDGDLVLDVVRDDEEVTFDERDLAASFRDVVPGAIREAIADAVRRGTATALRARGWDSAHLAGLVGEHGAHHEPVFDVDEGELARAICVVASETIAGLVRAETQRALDRVRGRVD
jgi:hypothetical protein